MPLNKIQCYFGVPLEMSTLSHLSNTRKLTHTPCCYYFPSCTHWYLYRVFIFFSSMFRPPFIVSHIHEWYLLKREKEIQKKKESTIREKKPKSRLDVRISIHQSPKLLENISVATAEMNDKRWSILLNKVNKFRFSVLLVPWVHGLKQWRKTMMMMAMT